MTPAQKKLEETRARILDELEQIRSAVTGYAANSNVTHRQVSELGEILLGLGRLPKVGKASGIRTAFAPDGSLRQVTVPKR